MDKDSVAAAATKVTYGGASGAILFVLHGVEPVTKGVRRSVVTWLVGPFFK